MALNPNDPKNAADPSSPFYQNEDWIVPDGYKYNGFTWVGGQPTNFDATTPPDKARLVIPGSPTADPTGAPPPASSTPGGATTGGTGDGSTGGSGGAGDGLVNPYTTPAPALPGAGTDYVPQTPTYPGAPTLGKPAVFTPTPWKAPTVDEALNDPGWQFRTQQGAKQLQNWAGAKGTLNDSSTGKALSDYGQNTASAEYQNVWNRDFGAWNADNANNFAAAGLNYQPQYLQPFQAASNTFQNTVVNPTQTAYSTQAQAGQYQTNANYQDAYQEWLQKYQMFRNRQLDTVNDSTQLY